MRKVSKKQARFRRGTMSYKKTLSPFCICCGSYGCDTAHIFNIGSYYQYKSAEWNLVIMCRECHIKFDRDVPFRQKQDKVVEIAKTYATREEVYRRFKLE